MTYEEACARAVASRWRVVESCEESFMDDEKRYSVYANRGFDWGLDFNIERIETGDHPDIESARAEFARLWEARSK